MAPTGAEASGIARGNAADTIALMRDLLAPTLGKGVLRRRPAIVGLLERTGCEERAIRRLQALRDKYGARPVLLSFFGRKQLIVTDPEAALRVLRETPDEFLSSSDEKSAALAHFEPGASLISDGAERRIRRDFNGRLLDEDCPRHRLAAHFRTVVRDEIDELLNRLERDGTSILAWESFFGAWNRIVRRVLLGDGARDDETLTEQLEKLRSAGNWAFLHPGRGQLRQDFHARLSKHLERAEWHSLAGLVANVPGRSLARPADQFTHYMFAFDPGGMATFRALALLSTHEAFRGRVLAEMEGEGDAMPLLRAAFLESLRLWPTTPVILRQARHDLDWEGDTLPAGAQVVIYAPFLHRDDARVDEAHRFAPELWPDGRVQRNSRFVPFSEGDGICPARDMVPLVGAMAMAELLRAREVRMRAPERLDPDQPLPATLDNYTLEFALEKR
jgi:cytochrome P450